MKSGNVVCTKTTFQSEIPLHLHFSSWPELKILHELPVTMSLFCYLIKLVLPEMCVEIKSISSQRAWFTLKWQWFQGARLTLEGTPVPACSPQGAGGRAESRSYAASSPVTMPAAHRARVHTLAREEMKTLASGLRRSKFLFRKGWEGKEFSPSGRKKSKFKCLVPMHSPPEFR